MSNGTETVVPQAVTDPSMAPFMARSPFRWQGDAGGLNWLNDLYNMGLNPPTLASVAPNTIVHGAPNTIVTLTGTGYFPSSFALVGATGLVTTYVSATSLKATIPAASLAAAGTLQISVKNPDARSSAQVPFTVT